MAKEIFFNSVNYTALHFDGTEYSCATSGADSIHFDGNDYLVCGALAAPSIVCPPNQVLAEGAAMTPISPTNSGGAVPAGGYSISPALPAGLSFDADTGEISGTPTTAAQNATFTITATNATGSNSCTLDILVTGTLAYSGIDCPVSFTLLANQTGGQTTQPYVPFTGGTPPYTWATSGLPTGATLYQGLGFDYYIELVAGSPATPIGNPAIYSVTVTDSSSPPQSLTCSGNQMEVLDAGGGTNPPPP